MLSSTQTWLNPEIRDVNDPGEITQPSEPQCPLWSEKRGQALCLLQHATRPGRVWKGRGRRLSLARLLLRDAGPLQAEGSPHSGAHSALPPPLESTRYLGIHPRQVTHRGGWFLSTAGDDGPVSWRPLGEKTEGSPALKGVRGPQCFCISLLYFQLGEAIQATHALLWARGTERSLQLGLRPPQLTPSMP